MELIRVTDLTYEVDDELILRVAGRSEEGERRTLEVMGTVPYFYIPEDAPDPQSVAPNDDWIRDVSSCNEAGEPFQSYDGEDLVRVDTQTPEQVEDLAEEYGETYESDLPFYRRCSLDYGLSGHIRVPEDKDRCDIDEIETDVSVSGVDEITPRIFIADIEILPDDEKTFDEITEDYTAPISHITVWDSYEDEYVCLYFDPDGQTEPSEIASYIDEASEGSDPVEEEVQRDMRLRSFESETALLDAYVDVHLRRHPDLVSGWNWVDFDWDYILGRMRVKEDEMSRRIHELSDNGYVSGYKTARKVDCVPAFDQMSAFCDKMSFSDWRSTSLNYVAKEVLGVGKLDSDSSDFEENRSKMTAYNIIDVVLCVAIDRREGVHDFFFELSDLSSIPVSDTMSEMRMVDGWMFKLTDHDEKLPPASEDDIPPNDGGLVLLASDGIEEQVGVVDLKSLYPSVISTWNISPETIHWYEDEKPQDVIAGDVTQSASYMDVPWVPDADSAEGGSFTSDEIDFDIMWTDLREEGIVPKYLKKLFPEREEKKQRRNEFDADSVEYDVWDRKQAAVKVIMNCFDGDTEVLTPNGVRNIKELDIGDEVYSINPDTRELEVKPVIDTTHSPNLYGELYDIQGQSVDLGVTPNHRMLVEDENTGRPEFVEAQDLDQNVRYNIPSHQASRGDEKRTWDWVVDGGLDGWVYLDYDEHGRTFKSKLPGEVADRCTYNPNRRMYSIPTGVYSRYADEIHRVAKSVGYQSGHKEATFPVRVEMDTLIRLVGWYVMEGYIGTHTNTRGGLSTTLRISQNDDENRHDIVELVEALGVNAGERNEAVEMSVRAMAKWFERECGRVAPEKRLPEFVFGLSTRQKEMLLETLVDGDGDRTDNGSIRYTTLSDELRDDVLRLAVECGYKPDYNRDSGVWRVFLSEYGDSFDLDSNGDVVDHDDDVYCVTVEDNHTVLAGRNGKFQWVGQSFYGVMSTDYWRLSMHGLGDAVTSAARYALWMGKEIAQEQGYEIIYGDSVPGYEPVYVRSDGEVDVLPIEDLHDRFDGSEEFEVWNDDGWVSLQNTIQKPNRKTMYRVTTNSGVVHVTEDHGLLREDGTEVPPTEIEVGDRLMHSPKEVDTFDGGMPDYDDYEVSDREAWLLGAFVGDGSAGTYKSKHGLKRQWKVSKNDPILLESVAQALRSEWGVSAKVEYVNSDEYTSRVMPNGNDLGVIQELVEEFRARCYDESGEKKVPQSVLNGDRETVLSFLAGYRAVDSEEDPRQDKLFTRSYTRSPTLAAGLGFLAQRLGMGLGVDVRDNHDEQYYRVWMRNWSRSPETEVTSVEQVSYADEYVYDLTTENEHFNAGIGTITVHNTDSCMISLADSDESKETALERGHELEETINDEMGRCVTNAGLESSHPYLDEDMHGTDRHALVYEFEKLYERFFQAGQQKKYAGRSTWVEGKDVDGKIDITGFESRRSDAPKLTSNVQPEVINRILDDAGFSDISEYIRGKIDDIESGEIDPYAVALPKAINQPVEEYPPRPIRRACRYGMRHFDQEWREGDDPWLFYIRRTPAMVEETDVIVCRWGEELPEGYEIDVDKMVERGIEKPLNPILEEMGWSFGELRNGSQIQSAADGSWEDGDWDEDEEDETEEKEEDDGGKWL